MPSPALNAAVIDTATPPIPAAKAWLTRYDGGYGPPVDLSQAAPGSPPPDSLLTRIGAAAALPEIARYGSIFGDEALRRAYVGDVSATYGTDIGANNIAITAGCNMAFMVAVMATAKAGDAVLLPTPWYFNHEMTLDMLGIEARALPGDPDRGFVPDAARAAQLIDHRVRAIVLVSPNNPSGAVYAPDVIAGFADLCRARGIWLILDETYRDFLPAQHPRPHDLFSRGEWGEWLIDLYSFSKSFAIPGHRLGAIAAGEAVIGQIGKVLDSLQICPPRAAQGAVAWGISALRSWREGNRVEINARADAFAAAMQRLPGWRIDSIGAYFAYLRHPFAGTPAERVAEKLAVTRGVLALPGSYFGPGQDGHLRVAFANADEATISRLDQRFNGFSL